MHLICKKLFENKNYKRVVASFSYDKPEKVTDIYGIDSNISVAAKLFHIVLLRIPSKLNNLDRFCARRLLQL